MRVLLVGNGNREHALAWKIRHSSLCTELFTYSSSPFLQEMTLRVPLCQSASYEELARFVHKEKISLLICGPEKPLAEGLVDALKSFAPNCLVVGPTRKAAQLEASKVFAKKMMMKAGIPTAFYEEVRSYESAFLKGLSLLKKNGGVVLKADGLASGKGVFVCHSEADVRLALERLKELFLESEPRILVEEELLGREFSYFSLVNEQFHTPLGCAVDFKRLEEGDRGPNTGGMGAYTPVPWLPKNWEEEIKEKIVDPLLLLLKEEGVLYHGILYSGLMLTASGIKVIEFNVRLGDPEAQALVVNDSRDYVELFLQSFEQKAGYTPFVASPSKTIAAVLASQDYPYCTAGAPQFQFAFEPSFFKNSKSPYLFASSFEKKDSLFILKKEEF